MTGPAKHADTPVRLDEPEEVDGDEVRVDPPEDDRQPGPEPVPQVPTWTVKPRRLNVRATPSADDAVIGILDQGTEVAVAEDNGDGWLLLADQPGWVMARHLE